MPKTQLKLVFESAAAESHDDYFRGCRIEALACRDLILIIKAHPSSRLSPR